MVVSGLLRVWLSKNQWFTGGWPDNIGQTFFLLILLHIKKPAQSCNLVSGLQSWSASIL